MEIILDRSHCSGTDLDRDIVSYAEARYMYRSPEYPAMDDSEGWQWEADEALIWMNDIEHDNERYYMIEENCLYLMEEEDIL